MSNLLTCSFTITFGALTSLSARLRLDFLAAGNLKKWFRFSIIYTKGKKKSKPDTWLVEAQKVQAADS